MDVIMPSVVPKYFLTLHFIENNTKLKLVGFSAGSTIGNKTNNNLPILDKIDINKNDINKISFMYEGGYNKPLVFKNNNPSIYELKEHKKNFELLLKLINNSQIIETKKEVDTRRFSGDAELEIINLDLKNKYTWTIFSLISEQPNKPEYFKGSLELRYYKYLNIAVTYWIKSEDDELLLKTFHNLCQSGKNIRTEPKKPIKLDLKQQYINFNINDLLKVEFFNTKINSDTIEITLYDKTWNMFSGYTKLRSSVFVENNYKNLNEFNNLKLLFKEKADTTIVINYNRSTIDKIHNRYTENPFLKRNHSVITNSFTYIEYWNFRGIIKQFSGVIKGSGTKDVIEFVDKVSESQLKQNTTSPYIKKLELIRDYFYEAGMEDGWGQKQEMINARNLIKKIDTMLSFDLKYRKEKLNIREETKEIVNRIKKYDTFYIKNKFYSFEYYNSIFDIQEKLKEWRKSIKSNKLVNENEYLVSKKKILVTKLFLPYKETIVTTVQVPFNKKNAKNKYIEFKYLEEKGINYLIDINTNK